MTDLEKLEKLRTISMAPIHFEGRELKPWAEFVLVSALKVGEVYFSLEYMDDEMLVPILEPLVFIGRNLVPKNVGQAYFQDFASYQEGVRWGSKKAKARMTKNSGAKFECHPETKTGEVGGIFEYEQALDSLMRCALKRRKV